MLLRLNTKCEILSTSFIKGRKRGFERRRKPRKLLISRFSPTLAGNEYLEDLHPVLNGDEITQQLKNITQR